MYPTGALSMNAIATPPSAEQAQPVWFAASSRLINGRPDARYGWLEDAAGPCIVKALDSQLAEFSAGLLDHEQRVLDRLRDEDAPVPDLVSTPQADWLVTRFAGLSMESLACAPQAEARFPTRERIAAWVHFLGRAQVFVEAGALPIDLWAGNLVLPLTGQTAGQLSLHRPVLIDHAHTVVVGMDMRRPVWIHSGMERVAPELRSYLQDDQAVLIRCFRDAGAALPGTASSDAEACRRSARLWARYDAPQQLQAALDRGELDPAAAIQFAVGVALRKLMDAAPPGVVAGEGDAVVAKMLSADPAQRFPSLDAARAACAGLLPALPRVGDYLHPQVRPAQLGGEREATLASVPPQPAAEDEEGTLFSSAGEGHGSPAGFCSALAEAPAEDEVPAPVSAAFPGRRLAWLAALTLLGAVIEQFLPWPLGF